MPFDLEALRPADASSASITTAISACAAARHDEVTRFEGHKATRKNLLMGGTDSQLIANERAQAVSQNAIERLDLLVEELKVHLVAAKETEARAAYVAEVEAYNAAETDFVTQWQERYPKLAGEIRELLLQERKCDGMLRKLLDRYRTGDVPSFPADGPPAPEWTQHRTRLFRGNRTMGLMIQLPDVNGLVGEHSPWCDIYRAPLRS
jgi:hypothetical protein